MLKKILTNREIRLKLSKKKCFKNLQEQTKTRLYLQKI